MSDPFRLIFGGAFWVVVVVAMMLILNALGVFGQTVDDLLVKVFYKT